MGELAITALYEGDKIYDFYSCESYIYTLHTWARENSNNTLRLFESSLVRAKERIPEIEIEIKDGCLCQINKKVELDETKELVIKLTKDIEIWKVNKSKI